MVSSMVGDDSVMDVVGGGEAGSASGGGVYTQAANFLSYVETGVDARTGLFTCSLRLPEVLANGLTGPAIGLGLSYSPLNGEDIGYGLGWSLSLSRYDRLAQVVSLSTGERFKVEDPAEDEYVFKDRKLKSFRMRRWRDPQTDENYYRIEHKSGLVELLSERDEDVRLNVAVPVELRSPSGRRLWLFYSGFNSHQRLSRIEDEAGGVLLQLTRTNGELTATLRPGTPQEVVFALQLIEGEVRRLALPVVPVENEAGWSFVYDDVGPLRVLRKVVSPLGGVEEATYKADGHQLPPGAPMERLPYVRSHYSDPGAGQPATVTSYDYYDYNFLGYGAPNLTYKDGEDNLYRVVMPEGQVYEYGSEARTRVGNAERVVRRRYNRFHLQVLEETTQEGKVLRVETAYYEDPNEPFARQPAYCQLPKTVKTVWYEEAAPSARREEVVETVYDDWGNVLWQRDETGIVRENLYYAAQGEDGCPADPFDFVRSVKEERITPANGGRLATGAPALVKRYRYDLLESLIAGEPVEPGEPVELGALVPVEEERHEADTASRERELARVRRRYFADKGAHHGRVQEETETLNGLTTTTAYVYHLADGALETARAERGFDGAERGLKRKQALASGLTVEEETEEGVRTLYEYDALGRPTSETVAPGTEYEATRRYAYHLVRREGEAAWQEEADPNGARRRRYLDGRGRVTRVEEEDVDHAPGEFRIVYEARYNVSDQLMEERQVDWVEGEAQPTLVTRYEYDAWGNVTGTEEPDGVRRRQQVDPIRLVERNWLESPDGARSGVTETVNNAFGEAEIVNRYDAQGVLVGSTRAVYDGLGRQVESVDALGRVTGYAYDAFDRRTGVTLPDGAVVETAYADHSKADLAVAITTRHESLGGVVEAGRRVFDGLDRLKEETVGGRRRIFNYEGRRLRPASQMTPAGDTLSYSYESLLGERLIRLQAEDAASFAYDSRTAQMIRAERGGREKQYEYSPSGRLKEERWGEGGKTVRTARRRHSLGGRPLGYTDVFGAEHVRAYDAAGRPSGLRHGGFEASLAYDGFGRLSRMEAVAGANSVVSEYVYDDFGREVERRWQVRGGGRTGAQTLTQSHDPLDRLTERRLREGGATLRLERFGYDAAGRLNLYECEGPHKPVDPWGKPIEAQFFTYDAFDRLLRLETRFEGGPDIANFSYEAGDAAQPTRITHSHPDYPASIQLEWDAGGRLIRDERGRRLVWDAQYRLIAVQPAGGPDLAYGYDAQGLLARIETADGPHERYYRDDTPICEIRGDQQVTWLREGGEPLAEKFTDSASRLTLLAAAGGGSIVLEADEEIRAIAYAPHGHRAEGAGQAALAFNGEPREPGSGLYLLGAGHHRPYSPTLMCFLAPDSESPFGGGGLNPYAYCAGDPVNRIDPTGHFWKWIVAGIGIALGVAATIATGGAAAGAVAAVWAGGLSALTASGAVAIATTTLSVVSLVTGVASLGLEAGGQAKAAGVLGWVSLGTGVASAAAAVAPAAAKATTNAATRLSRFTQSIRNSRTSGLGANVADVAGEAPAAAARRSSIILGYHGTSAENAQAIMREGFNKYPVYVTDSLQSARHYAPGPGDDILEIFTRKPNQVIQDNFKEMNSVFISEKMVRPIGRAKDVIGVRKPTGRAFSENDFWNESIRVRGESLRTAEHSEWLRSRFGIEDTLL